MQIVTNKRLKIAEKFIGMRNAYNHNCKRGGDGLLIRNKKVTNRSDRDSKLRNIIIVEGDGTMKNKKMTFLTTMVTAGMILSCAPATSYAKTNMGKIQSIQVTNLPAHALTLKKGKSKKLT